MAYEVIQVPRDTESVQSYVERYKTFRLLALKTSPEAFGSTYEREIAFTDDIWKTRLSNPNATTFVALQDGQFMCTLTILGPLSFGPESISPSANPWEFNGGVGQPEAHWRFNAMFTHPTARGQGMAKALIKQALQYGRDHAVTLGKPFVGSIVVDEENMPAKTLYEKCGFLFVMGEPYEAHGKTQQVLLMQTK